MKARLNLTIDRAVADQARALGLNMSQIAERALAEAGAAERNRRWVADNCGALDAYATEIESAGLALERYRLF